jgi:pSer/pThr/pTyr-binding forkhead associated (FHA) protein
MPQLILTNPVHQRQSCFLPDGRFTLGRSSHNKIILQDDSVSAQHCELLVHGREVIVRDRNSRNGTFVNGTRVKSQHGVNHGQAVRFGTVEARIEIEPPPHDDDTAMTAFHHHRKAMRQLTQPPPDVSPLPISFTSANTNVPLNTTFFPPPAPESTTSFAVPPQAPPLLLSRFPRPKPWMWLTAECTALALFNLWMVS